MSKPKDLARYLRYKAFDAMSLDQRELCSTLKKGFGSASSSLARLALNTAIPYWIFGFATASQPLIHLADRRTDILARRLVACNRLLILCCWCIMWWILACCTAVRSISKRHCCLWPRVISVAVYIYRTSHHMKPLTLGMSSTCATFVSISI